MRDVIISITGTQNDISGENDSMELVTAGQYCMEDGVIRFSYDESDLTGLKGTRTTFTVNPMGVIMHREGSTNSQMIFEPGKKSFFLYETPYGSATMGVSTRHIDAELGEHGGRLELDYDIDINHTLMERNQFKIHVRENRTNG